MSYICEFFAPQCKLIDFTELDIDLLLRVAVAVVGDVRSRTSAALSAQLLVHLHFHDLLDDEYAGWEPTV